MYCKRCKSQQAYIRQAEDSYAKEVVCPNCLLKTPLKGYNNENNHNYDAND